VTTFMAICRTLGIDPTLVDDEGAASLVRYGHDGDRTTGASLYLHTQSGEIFCMSKKNLEVIEGHGPWTMHHDQRLFKNKAGRLWKCSPK
jgi:hypothetical protein